MCVTGRCRGSAAGGAAALPHVHGQHRALPTAALRSEKCCHALPNLCAVWWHFHARHCGWVATLVRLPYSCFLLYGGPILQVLCCKGLGDICLSTVSCDYPKSESLFAAGTPSSMKSFPAESIFYEAQILPQSATAAHSSRSAAEAAFPCKPRAQTPCPGIGGLMLNHAMQHASLTTEDWRHCLVLCKPLTQDLGAHRSWHGKGLVLHCKVSC